MVDLTMNPIGMVMTGELTWFPRLGFGYVSPDVDPIVYGEEYFQNYLGYDANETSSKLTAARVELVRRHYAGGRPVVDIGIGAGAFVRGMMERGLEVEGFDVMPDSIVYLKHRDLWRDPYADRIWAATFWDSLEHIHDPGRILAQIDGWAFVSMPIYTSSADALNSKHFKPGEHIWYFTQRGLVEYMASQGFELREESTCEVDCGREAIGAFAFERVRR